MYYLKSLSNYSLTPNTGSSFGGGIAKMEVQRDWGCQILKQQNKHQRIL